MKGTKAMKKRVATLTHKRQLLDGTYVALLTCGACGRCDRVGFAGWSGGECPGCGTWIVRPKYTATKK